MKKTDWDIAIVGLCIITFIVCGCLAEIFNDGNEEIERALKDKLIRVEFSDGQIVEKTVKNFTIINE